MIKRAINQRFNEAVLERRKITTIRDKVWPTNFPIMLFNWAGKPYRSKHVDLCPITVTGFWPIEIVHREDGEMIYRHGLWIFGKHLHETEGFTSKEDMDNWFRPLVKPGQASTKILHRFRRG
jgi:hypothetical protein